MLDKNKKAKVLNITLVIVLCSFLAIALTLGTAFAALTVKKSSTVQFGVAGLNATVSGNTISVQNDVACVMRVAPKNEKARQVLNAMSSDSAPVDIKPFVAQYNGWFYYKAVIGVHASSTALTTPNSTTLKSLFDTAVGGVANISTIVGNVLVELMQEPYSTHTVGGKVMVAGGFVKEWAYSDETELSAYTPEGVLVSSGTFAAFVGSDEVANNLGSASAGLYSYSTGSSYGYRYNTGSANLTINSATPLRLYNNTYTPFIISFDTYGIDATLVADIKASNTGWKTASDSDSGLPSGSTEIYNENVLMPGEYFTFLYVCSATSAAGPLHIVVSALNASEFFVEHTSNPTSHDPYLAWLDALGGNYYTHFVNSI